MKASQGLSVYFFGDSETVLEKLSNNIKSNFPNTNITGFANGYYYSTDEIIKKINSSNPAIVFVGLGVARQEKWICTNHEKLNAKLILSVGGWFQYLAKSKKRAPFVMRKLSLEWLYKLITDFKRTYLRYFWGVPIFFYRILTKKIILEFEKKS